MGMRELPGEWQFGFFLDKNIGDKKIRNEAEARRKKRTKGRMQLPGEWQFGFFLDKNIEDKKIRNEAEGRRCLR